MRAFKGPKHQRGFFGIAALAVSAIGVGSSIKAAGDASDDASAANATQRKINKLKNAQAKRQFLRKFRQAQANTLSAGIASGAGLESSRVLGTAASQTTQALTGVKEFEELDKLGAQHGSQLQSAADNAFKSAAFGQVASFASSFVSFGKRAPSTTPVITETDIPS